MRVPPPDVIAAAQAAQRNWRVPASISLAQWALESAWGERTTGTFNFFGIKADQDQIDDGAYTTCQTHEVVNGVSEATQAHFANYTDLEDGFDAHAALLATSSRYNPAMQAAPDPFKFAEQLQACGYATDPSYAQSLKALLEGNKLTDYDLTGPT